MNLFSGTIQTLEGSLDFASAKNRVISNNIANVDTPGYKTKDVTFKRVFDEELNVSFQAKQTQPCHIPFSQENPQQPFQIVTKQNTTYNHNGNNVDIDKEMTELAKNQIYYQSLVDRLNGKFNNLQTVIKGGR
ncbi:flagellar basal body rod protein FlgB [Lentibacillus cibarius]|uniref:Flagellar basal body rod protein FlgB n=1 Tax=Lentibacillus cibarius TaxID=2583219 RepID=A0A549YKK2_9BACI|nr:flagellar basal body rod protein FlgB [Lentibacillus cibarius]TRM12394.1 flagellar basal body rod protein FlgB [Lentibacillus cibarius]